MTQFLDAYALIAFAADEPAADEVEIVLRRGSAAVTAVNLAEAIDVLARRHGQSQDRLHATLDPLLDGTVLVHPVSQQQAWRAAELRSRHYHRRSSPLSLADCMLLAAAGPEDSLVTADIPIAVAAGAESITVIALPGS